MAKHYIRYRKNDADNPLASKEGAFEAWAEVRESQPGWRPPVQPGDTVWVFSGTDTGGRRKHYRVEYYFKADRPAEVEGNRLVIRGTKGAFVGASGNIGDALWFDDFFNTIGRGGTSFQAIPQLFLQYFQWLLQAVPIEKDRIDALSHDEADNEGEDALVYRTIRQRRGQPEFRRRLLEAYGTRCCITGCMVPDVLEAAHIAPHSDEPNYRTSNGLLLRADIHTLFDLYLLAVDENDRVVVSRQRKDSEYAKLHGQRITPPERLADAPNSPALARRLKRLFELDGTSPRKLRRAAA